MGDDIIVVKVHAVEYGHSTEYKLVWRKTEIILQRALFNQIKKFRLYCEHNREPWRVLVSKSFMTSFAFKKKSYSMKNKFGK